MSTDAAIDEPSESGDREIDGQVREGNGRDKRERTSQILYRNDGSGSYFAQDHEGSVILVTSGVSGGIREWYRYDAFGAPTIHTPWGQSINNRFLFTGREYVPLFGFYEYRARAYHPTIGRFMSEDPMLFVHRMGLSKPPSDWSFSTSPDEAEWNLFRYCGNDPWDFVDPMGLRDVDVYVWEASRSDRSVGHVMVTEHQSHDVLLSQFPRARGQAAAPRGFNRRFSFEQTMAEEAESSKILVVHVPDDKAFDRAVKDHTTRKTWDWHPNRADETHCARAAHDSLKAGGVPLPENKGQILPGTVGRELEKAMKEQRGKDAENVKRETHHETGVQDK